MSPYQLVYGADAIFPTSLGVPVMKLIQEVQSKENYMQRRINQTCQVNMTRGRVNVDQGNSSGFGAHGFVHPWFWPMVLHVVEPIRGWEDFIVMQAWR